MLNWLSGLVTTAMVMVCTVALGATLVTFVLAHQGYRAYTMLTPSMSPMLNPGDLVVVHLTQLADIKTGDVITFQEPIGDHLLVTHRVVQIATTSHGPSFTTKGDQNNGNDPWKVQYSDAVGWRVAFALPGVGGALAFLQSAPGRLIIAGFIFLIVVTVLWPLVMGNGEEVAEPESEPEPTSVPAPVQSAGAVWHRSSQ